METKSVQLENKVVQPKTYFYYRTTTTLRKIMEVAENEVQSLMTETEKLKLEVAGPMEFVFFDCTEDPDKPFTLDIAQSVQHVKPIDSKKYGFRKTGTFKCIYTNFYGDINKIGDEYDAIFKAIYAKEIPVTNEIREVYLTFGHMSDPENVTEIQIGLK